MNKIGDIKGKNILLLQGPVGPFFKKLGKQFSKKGARVYRIGLNAGDGFFASSVYYTAFREKPEAWYTFILAFLNEHHIDKIFIFGD